MSFTENQASFSNRVTDLFQIQYPLVQAGMIWASGWRLASAVSNAGGLGLIGAGSMYPDTLLEHIRKCKAATGKTFGVNLPLLYPDIDQHIKHIIAERVPVVFTSAGNPKTWTATLKAEGIKVVHVVSSAKFALKSQDAGVDAVVAEGFEAGGHNGREETTTLCLIPQVRQAVEIPLIAAGGIGTGRAMYAAMALGAEGVQIGSRFVCSPEASSHQNFKDAIVQAGEGDTMLSLKRLTPVRLIKNHFYNEVQEAELRGASPEELTALLGRARAKKGMFEGDLEQGELEIGQVSGLINTIKPAADIVTEIWNEFAATARQPFYTAQAAAVK
ncbi:NAD(P)H-dependent flavin oxidoreductase [Taibaiella chishuiensis]|uniref:Enoyl-[acyl-carrier protein] reductase II n=1 Tax=Taibaiella chishuiensis TaxID=1434707 RepID=A0A2P8DA21_9BACT|nr:nitronate monooxygenase [Taibaiella chishuiensis]PSK94066.1 enoyl-[acyl-carrier protein] reductase II [Taibaiella chishuiensis]